MRRDNRIITVYDKNGDERAIEETWSHTADDVPMVSELFTVTPTGVWSRVNDKGGGVYEVVENGEILTEKPAG
jgi:hypothetical protein